jgi:RNA-directed DNA polymerase
MPLVHRAKFEEAFSRPVLEALFEERIKKSKSVGRDGVRPSSFEAKLLQEVELIARKAIAGSYRFTRYKEKLISKGADKPPRILSIPTVRDRLTLRALTEFIADVYKDVALQKPHSFIKSIRQRLNDAPPDTVFLRLDIENYYGSIDKPKLVSALRKRIRLPQAIQLTSAAIQTPTISKSGNEPGIPQGLSISNILAAVYLADCDQQMKLAWNYYRYVDDILVICHSEQVGVVLDQLGRILKRKKLKYHPLDKVGSKSYIALLADGVEYLGFKIFQSGISIRDSSYRKMFKTIGSVLTEFRFKKSEERLVWRLNLKISGCTFEGKNFGWMFFFLQTDDMKQLARLDHFIYLQLRDRGLAHLRPRVKRFIRAYHEIRYNQDDTKYVPNFDDYTEADMKRAIHEVRGVAIQELNAMTVEELKKNFFAMVGKEVGDLEKDLIEAFS